MFVAFCLLACAVMGAQAGDPASAARHLGHGVKLASPALAAAGPASQSQLLSFEPSTADLCPVVAYGVDVLPMEHNEALALAASSPANQGLFSAAQEAAPAGAKPFKIVLTPLSYMQNATVPSVDWVDVHFKVRKTRAESEPGVTHVSSLARFAHLFCFLCCHSCCFAAPSSGRQRSSTELPDEGYRRQRHQHANGARDAFDAF
jgi:hypothetical protein